MPAFLRAAGLSKVAAAALALVTICCCGALGQEDEEADDRGLTEYEISCMPCHGANGKGDGPQAAKLTIRPADLSMIQAKNGGIFPDKRVRDMIDGRAGILAHGKREMPVWGDRYRVPIDSMDKPAEVESRASDLIDALVEYIKTLQNF